MRHYKRAIHLDFHTMPKVPDVGADFDARRFARTLSGAGVEFVTFFAKCNLGFAYYPTKVGLVHPGLQRDMLGPAVRECHKRGIGVVAYFNAGLDHENASRHRDWCILSRTGQVHTEDRLGHFFRRMCFDSPYGDYLAGMVEEVVDLYPVDGVFLDCIPFRAPCYGRECLDAMAAEGADILDDEQVGDFSQRKVIRFMERIVRIVGRRRLLFFNGVPYRVQLPYCSHLEVECLPTGEWGYEFFPVIGRYVRKLGKPATLMTGRFHKSWADFGGLRPQASLEFDAHLGQAAGLTLSVGDHMHPRGRLDAAVYERVGEVYRQAEALSPWTQGARGVAEIGVLAPAAFNLPAEPVGPALAGAARMLSELNYQFDVVDHQMSFDAYSLLVLPDDVPVGPALKAALRRHLRGGGRILSSASAGLTPDGKGFALREWNVRYLGPSRYNVSFYVPGRPIARDLPDMPLAIYMPGIDMKAATGSRRWARVHRPYFNRHWDGHHGNVYIPPDAPAPLDAVVRSGPVVHVSFPVFSAYNEHAATTDRILVRNCIEHLLPDPLVRTEGLPTFGRVMLTARRTMTMAHVLCYCPEHKGRGRGVVEEPMTVRDVTVKVRDGRIRRAFLAPSKQPVALTREGEYACATLEEVRGFALIVFARGR